MCVLSHELATRNLTYVRDMTPGGFPAGLILGPPFRSQGHQGAIILELHVCRFLLRTSRDEELEGRVPEEGDVHHDILGDRLKHRNPSEIICGPHSPAMFFIDTREICSRFCLNRLIRSCLEKV